MFLSSSAKPAYSMEPGTYRSVPATTPSLTSDANGLGDTVAVGLPRCFCLKTWTQRLPNNPPAPQLFGAFPAAFTTRSLAEPCIRYLRACCSKETQPRPSRHRRDASLTVDSHHCLSPALFAT